MITPEQERKVADLKDEWAAKHNHVEWSMIAARGDAVGPMVLTAPDGDYWLIDERGGVQC